MPTTYNIDASNSIEVADKNGLEMVAGDILQLDETGKIVVNGTAGYGVNINGSDTKLNIDGKILTQTGAVQITGERAQINIGLRGELISASSHGLSTIELYTATSGSLVINNYGKIVSTGTASAIATNGTLNLFNAGLISTAPSLLNVAIYGNAGDDIINNVGKIIGDIQFSSGNNIYYGFGGTVVGQIKFGSGNDKAYGGSSAEIFDLGQGNDFVNGGGGRDTLRISSSSAGVTIDLRITGPQNIGLGTKTIINVENIEIITAGANKLIGNNLANKFSGSDTSDILEGGGGNDTLSGGLGNDIMKGGSGKDVFVFNTAPNSSTNKDVIDFNVKDDTIWVENAIFTALKKTGTLKSSYFVLGAKAKDGNDYFGYDKKTGNFWYDPNGNKAGGLVVLADLGKNKLLTYHDIVVI